VDHATVSQARRGDRQAMAALLHALQDPWYRMCLSLLADPDLAREATQETAVRFLRQLKDFRGDSRLRTWSLGICINVVREMRRARRGWDLPDRMIEPACWPDTGPMPLFAAQQSEEAGALREVLASLPDRQREAVVLRFLEELSVAQTARAMHCAPGTVKATVHQALRTLRRRLRQLVA
jgi:RNA polymerase sigma-70 factor (ECF subfamily)